jgi:hypothetical protein
MGWRHSRMHAGGGIAVTIFLLFAGTVFLLFNLGVLHSEMLRMWWPGLFILVGAVKLLGRGRQQPLTTRSRHSGL